MISYEEDLGGYDNYEQIEETLSWEELFEDDFKLYIVSTNRQPVKL